MTQERQMTQVTKGAMPIKAAWECNSDDGNHEGNDLAKATLFDSSVKNKKV